MRSPSMSSPVPCGHFVSGRVRQASDGAPRDSARHMPDVAWRTLPCALWGRMVTEREICEVLPLPAHGRARAHPAPAKRGRAPACRSFMGLRPPVMRRLVDVLWHDHCSMLFLWNAEPSHGMVRGRACDWVGEYGPQASCEGGGGGSRRKRDASRTRGMPQRGRVGYSVWRERHAWPAPVGGT